VRKGKAAQFANGMKIDMLENRRGKKNFIGKYAIKVTETLMPSDGFDAVIVPTKPYQLVEALRQIVPLIGNADYLLLTQNWNGTAEIGAVLPQSRYIYGDAHAGGVFKDGLLVGVIMNDIVLGQVDGKQDAILEKFVALFENIQMKAVIPENILHYIWVQYAINAGLWPALIRATSLDRLLRNRKLGDQSLQAVKECLDVVAARGVDLRKYPDTRMFYNPSPIMRCVAGYAITLMFRFNEAVRRASAHALGDPREIVAAYFDLLSTGRELGIPMPVMNSYEAEVRHFADSQNKMAT
jgi:2-dehydropantoate 2-reductase